MSRVLKQSFYRRDTKVVACELLGKMLCRRLPSGRIIRGRITETEAYDGFEDRASHSHKGPTSRNVVMFGSPGCAYIYLCYGVHWMLNFTTRESGYPAAVLVRAVEGVDGPGRTTRHFKINGKQNQQVLSRVKGLWVEDDGLNLTSSLILRAPRVGVAYAGAKWAAKPWRFIWPLSR
ncbi:MAG: Putative 3-methyladenine DNA glycosylase [Opitutia bacterium UBA7350]|nr:MAG: Putative 3-methyladenine DNA glycosylase [Opitutae bacterium UBA7350]